MRSYEALQLDSGLFFNFFKQSTSPFTFGKKTLIEKAQHILKLQASCINVGTVLNEGLGRSDNFFRKNFTVGGDPCRK